MLGNGNRYDYRVFEQARSDALFCYHTDHLGTPIAMTNGSGGLAWRAEQLPFGELFSNTVSDISNNLRFPGQYFDAESGLHQNWFRDYQPKTGRYQEADPIGLLGGLNLYAYVRNSPSNLMDRSGLADDASPWRVGWEWLTGRGPRSHHFTDNDPFTEQLRRAWSRPQDRTCGP